MQLKNRGENLTKFELLEISHNFRISNHAKEMIEKREGPIDLKEMIENPFAAYFNTDCSINIAKDLFNYAVVVWDHKKGVFTIVTWKELSWNKVSVLDKQQLAIKGISRRN